MSSSNNDSGIPKIVVILTAFVGLITAVLTCTKEGLTIKKEFFGVREERTNSSKQDSNINKERIDQNNKDANRGIDEVRDEIPYSEEKRRAVGNDFDKTKPEIVEKEEKLYTVVEQQPEFPGGVERLGRFLQANLRYPAMAQRANISGKVIVSFIVNTDGSIQDVQVIKSLGFGTLVRMKKQFEL